MEYQEKTDIMLSWEATHAEETAVEKATDSEERAIGGIEHVPAAQHRVRVTTVFRGECRKVCPILVVLNERYIRRSVERLTDVSHI